MEAEDWGVLLDKLSQSITAKEEEQVRGVASKQDVPNHMLVMHRFVASLLVKHGIATWQQLRTSFPEYHKDDDPVSGGRAPCGNQEPRPGKGVLGKRPGEEKLQAGSAGKKPAGGHTEANVPSTRQSPRSAGKASVAAKKTSAPAEGQKAVVKEPSKKSKVSEKKEDTIPIRAGVGKRLLTARFNWRTMLVVMEDGSTLEPQEFCSRVSRKSPWREVISTKDDAGWKPLGVWLKERCSVCQEPGNEDLLLLCETDGCGTFMHTYCLRPKLAGIPEDEWFCPSCRRAAKA